MRQSKRRCNRHHDPRLFQEQENPVLKTPEDGWDATFRRRSREQDARFRALTFFIFMPVRHRPGFSNSNHEQLFTRRHENVPATAIAWDTYFQMSQTCPQGRHRGMKMVAESGVGVRYAARGRRPTGRSGTLAPGHSVHEPAGESDRPVPEAPPSVACTVTRSRKDGAEHAQQYLVEQGRHAGRLLSREGSRKERGEMEVLYARCCGWMCTSRRWWPAC